MAKNTKKYDVVIVGGGFAGMTLALGLVQIGLHVACLDKENPDFIMENSNDVRTVAISNGSSRVFQRVSVWDEMVKNGCEIRKIDIFDGNYPQKLNFDSKEVKNSTFGWIFDNVFVRKVLKNAIEQVKNVDYMAPVVINAVENKSDGIGIELENGQKMSATLLVGADGRQSFVRNVQNIRSFGWSYRQMAITCVICHDKPHENTAIEHFTPDGPFATLPMLDDERGNHCSSIVWTLPVSSHKQLLNCDEVEFSHAVELQMKRRFGNIRLMGKRQAYPLSFSHAYGYVAERTVLVADAAHGIHPIAGQGLNLGMRDIGVLLDVVGKAVQNGGDIGDQNVLKAYERKRILDNTLMCIGTDILNTVFKIEFTPFKQLRQWGVQAVDRVPPLKHRLMRYAMGLPIVD